MDLGQLHPKKLKVEPSSANNTPLSIEILHEHYMKMLARRVFSQYFPDNKLLKEKALDQVLIMLRLTKLNFGSAKEILEEWIRAMEKVEMGDKGAQLILSQCSSSIEYLNNYGQGKEIDRTLAVAWAEVAYENGVDKSISRLASLYENTGKTQRAIELYEEAVQSEDPWNGCPNFNAITAFGLELLKIPESKVAEAMKDPQMCLKIDLLDKNHFGKASRELGIFYFNGDFPFPKDPNRAFIFFKKAASAGSGSARGYLKQHFDEDGNLTDPPLGWIGYLVRSRF